MLLHIEEEKKTVKKCICQLVYFFDPNSNPKVNCILASKIGFIPYTHSQTNKQFCYVFRIPYAVFLEFHFSSQDNLGMYLNLSGIEQNLIDFYTNFPYEMIIRSLSAQI